MYSIGKKCIVSSSGICANSGHINTSRRTSGSRNVSYIHWRIVVSESVSDTLPDVSYNAFANTPVAHSVSSDVCDNIVSVVIKSGVVGICVKGVVSTPMANDGIIMATNKRTIFFDIYCCGNGAVVVGPAVNMYPHIFKIRMRSADIRCINWSYGFAFGLSGVVYGLTG